MTTPAQDVFEFWEASLSDRGDALPHSCTSDPLSLSRELHVGEWSEQEAGLELARRCSLTDLRAAQTQLLATLQWSLVALPQVIGVSRALWIALDIAAAREHDR